MIVNQSVIDGVTRSYRMLFKKALAETPSMWKDFSMEIKSTSREEVYTWFEDFPTMREWVGGRHIKNLIAHEYTLKNKRYETTIGVSVDDIQDGKAGGHAIRFQALGQEAKRHIDILLFDLMKDGFEKECYDGQYFFDTDHPVGGTSVSNSGGGSGEPWFLFDLSRVLKPFFVQIHTSPRLVVKNKPSDEGVFNNNECIFGVDDRKNAGYALWQLGYGSKDTLNAANYAAARAAMMSYKSEDGVPLGIIPTHLVYGPSLESAARSLIVNQNDAAGASNPWFNTVKPVLVPYLA
jgi:phage major head subunit gpT-like protein